MHGQPERPPVCLETNDHTSTAGQKTRYTRLAGDAFHFTKGAAILRRGTAPRRLNRLSIAAPLHPVQTQGAALQRATPCDDLPSRGMNPQLVGMYQRFSSNAF